MSHRCPACSGEGMQTREDGGLRLCYVCHGDRVIEKLSDAESALLAEKARLAAVWMSPAEVARLPRRAKSIEVSHA